MGVTIRCHFQGTLNPQKYFLGFIGPKKSYCQSFRNIMPLIKKNLLGAMSF